MFDLSDLGLCWATFRPLVCLWRPFHRCFVRLRRAWDAKSDIIDVFITFFLLSFSKCLYQTILLLIDQYIINYDESGQYIDMYHRLFVDLNIVVGSANHLILAIPATLFFFTFVILPPLVLTLYPVKAFRSCLSKCHLNFIAVDIFVDISTWLLQEWLGWRKRYEEPFWSLFLSKDSGDFNNIFVSIGITSHLYHERCLVPCGHCLFNHCSNNSIYQTIQKNICELSRSSLTFQPCTTGLCDFFRVSHVTCCKDPISNPNCNVFYDDIKKISIAH